MNNMKIRFSVIFIILTIGVFYILNYEKQNTIEYFLSKKTEQFSHAYKIIYNQHKELASFVVLSILEDKTVVDIYKKISTATNNEKNKLREKLYKYLITDYKNLKLNNVTALHFHLPDNKSFLRMHKPKKFGDSLKATRDTITYVNKNHKPIEGFETGKAFIGFRFVYPILDEKNNHLGSVEMSFGSESFTTKLMNEYNTLSNFLTSGDVINKKVWKTEQSNFIKSPYNGFYFNKTTLKSLKIEDRKNNRKKKPSKELANNITKHIKENQINTVYLSNIKQTITIIPIQNPITKEVIAALTVRSDGEFISNKIENFYIMVMLITILIVAILFTIYKEIQHKLQMKLLNKELEIKVDEKTQELHDINNNLDNKVKEQIEKIREQDKILIQQSKMASMGEMIGNIAHQWRQPLNLIGTSVMSLQMSYENDLITDEFIDKYAAKINKTIQSMSNTIDDFRNFFVPNKEKIDFDIKESIEKTLNLLGSSFKINNINISIQCDNSSIVNGYRNEFLQAILVLVNNSKDAIVQNKIKDANIKIDISSSIKTVKITIKDNGGGIPQDIINKVFEPYFTTKFKSQGTGIGLYMSKMIIENNMGGELSVRNDKEGAVFTIELNNKGIN